MTILHVRNALPWYTLINYMLTSADVQRLETLLLAHEERLTKDLLEIADEDPTNPGTYIAKHMETGGDTDDDNGLESTALSDDMPVVDKLQEELRDVRKALLTVKSGTYGICKYCNKAIDLKRLEARPESSSCVACKKTLTQEL